MLVAVSVDMEGASQLRNVRETFGCMPEYWQAGKTWLEADVAAACDAAFAAAWEEGRALSFDAALATAREMLHEAKAGTRF